MFFLHHCDFSLLIYEYNRLHWFSIFNQPCLPAINPIWSECVIVVIYCWILFANILLSISLFIRNIGLHDFCLSFYFLYSVPSNFCVSVFFFLPSNGLFELFLRIALWFVCNVFECISLQRFFVVVVVVLSNIYAQVITSYWCLHFTRVKCRNLTYFKFLSLSLFLM